MIEKNPANGRFQRVTPLTMAARLAAVKPRASLERRRVSTRPVSYTGPRYTGPLTRAEVAEMMTS